MLAISFRFPGRRYHATPWGRHVNEADVSWPPEPWRLLRGLLATWHRKGHVNHCSHDLLQSLIYRLAEHLPVYELPAAVLAHSRHYMPDGAGKPSLVFDAFARMTAGATLVVAWPDVRLPPEEEALLICLLTDMGYLGRAESWVEAELMPSWSGPGNCFPEQEGAEDDGDWELVSLLAPISAGAYDAWLAGYRDALKNLQNREQSKVNATLPNSLLAALQQESGDLRQTGWSRPPGARKVAYRRRADCFRPQRGYRGTVTVGESSPTTARFALMGHPLPLLEDAVKVGERFRWALMGKSRWEYGEQNISPVFSGHGLPADNRHGHAFFLPEDGDGDGRIDHLLLYAPMGLQERDRHILGLLQEVRGEEESNWPVFLEGIFHQPPVQSTLQGKSRDWVSITPYLHPWFAKKGFGIEEQLRRECQLRGWPELVSLELLPHIQIHGRERRTLHFHRFRSKKGLSQPDSRGGFWRLTFSEAVMGPLALGFGCHFGLGLFTPDKS